jgi:hypothetical protein
MKQEPVMSESTEHTVDPQTAQVLDNIVLSQRRLKEVEADNARLNASLDQSEREVEFLRESLQSCERKRDMFQRHAVALYTRLVDLIPAIRLHADTIENALKDAKIEAMQKRTPAPPVDLDKGIREIAESNLEDRKED